MQLRPRILSAFDHFDARPALAERNVIPTSNAELGEASAEVLNAYTSITYEQLERRVKSVAAQLQSGPRGSTAAPALHSGDRVALLGHAGVDFTTVDFACNITGLTTVPLQTSGTYDQHSAVVGETGPRALATTVSLLDRAMLLVDNHPTIKRVILLDYRGGEREHRAAVDAIAPAPHRTIETLDLDGYARELVDPRSADTDLAMLLYTSGSTGAPKGAMYTARLVAQMLGGEGWSEFFAESKDVANFHYMPMSHVAGHSSIRSTLARGGVTYFASTTNLSSFFADLQRSRPTELSLVPRVCELLRQEFDRRVHSDSITAEGSTGARSTDVKQILELMREDILGGRVQWASCTSAPVSRELKSFMESLLGIELHEMYGTTEIGGVLADGTFLSPPVIDYKLEDVPELGYFSSDRPSSRGELLIKSTSTVPGYFNRPDLDEVIFTADGYYRTGDIVAVDVDDKVRIIDRKNAIIKLSQGEFVALPSLEAKLVAGSDSVHQIFLYGESDRSSIVGVVVPSDRLRAEHGDDESELRAQILDDLRKVAASEGFNSYEIPTALVVEPEPFSESNGLLSDHRKPVRPRLTARYGAQLRSLYDSLQASHELEIEYLREHGAEQDTLTTVRRAVAVSIHSDHRDIAADAKFRTLGGDSLSALYLSRLLEQIYRVRITVDTVASETYTLSDLATLIDSKRVSQPTTSFDDIHGAEPASLQADDLRISRFIHDIDRTGVRKPVVVPSTRRILVTGASGYLGRFLCLEWLREFAGSQHSVVCMVRARDDTTAFDRLRSAYSTSDELLTEFDSLAANLTVIAGDFSEVHFGLDERIWSRLAQEVTEIVHAGAMVNHVLPYRELFAPNVFGTAEVVRLALSEVVKPVTFMSSIATALLPDGASPITELCDIREALAEVDSGGGMVDGYAKTKWAAEVLLRDAHAQYGLPVTVFRSSMILAHSVFRGQINTTDTFARLLYSLVRTGIAPDSFYRHDGHRSHYDGLPVDTVAQVISSLANAHAINDFATYHLVNPHDDGVSLDVFVDWLIDAGVPLTKIGSYDHWLPRFRSALGALDERGKAASMFPLLAGIEHAEIPTYGSLIGSSELQTRLVEIGGNVVIGGLTQSFLVKCLRDLEQDLVEAKNSPSDIPAGQAG